jgi:protein arginine kinase
MDLDQIVFNPCEWMRGTGPESNIVISSRLRLARNIKDYAFAGKLTPKRRLELIDQVKEATLASPILKKNEIFQFKGMNALNRQLLVERHLVSVEFAGEKKERALSLSDNEVISLMILEEDHLRLQVLESGLNLKDCWTLIDQTESELSKKLPFSFSDRFGYLTACPTNVGTGLRASCMLHLPGLVLTKQINKVLQALAKLNMAIRGLYGEGSEASGNFFQVSNQITLGQSEEEIIDSLERVIRQVISHEKEARKLLQEKKKDRLADQVWRAVGILKSARVLSSQESATFFSLVRLGLDLGFIKGITIEDLNKLFISTQPAHLQKIAKKNLGAKSRDSLRAETVRLALSGIQL